MDLTSHFNPQENIISELYDKECSSDIFSEGAFRDYEEITNSTKIKTFSQLQAEMDLSWYKNKNYRIVNTKDDLYRCAKEMIKAPLIGFDTETTGLTVYNISHNNPHKDKLCGLCLSWEKNQGIYVPTYMANMDNLDLSCALDILQPILERKALACHNGMFDAKVMYDLGIILNIIHDTALLQFNIDSDIFRGTRKLKGLVKQHLGYDAVEFEDIFEYKKDYRLFRYVSEEVARVYACADADHTLQLVPILLNLISRGQLRGYKRNVEMIIPFMRSEYEGKSVDYEKLELLNNINDKDIETVKHLIYRYVGTELAYRKSNSFSSEMFRFSITSSSQLADVVYNKLKYPRPEIRHKGRGMSESKVSISKRQLAFWAKSVDTTGKTLAAEKLLDGDLLSNSINHPELGLEDSEHVLLKKDKFVKCRYRLSLLITLYRTLFKNKTSFFAPLLKGNTEGKYFSNINMQRAATFRVLDPIQTLDKRLKKVIAPSENQYQIAADWSQVEARVAAGFAHDEQLVAQLDDFEADYHRLAAAAIQNKLPEEVTDEERKAYKPINFGIIFGIGAKGIVDQKYGVGIEEEKYKELIKETQQKIDDWKVGMHYVQDALDRARAIAVTPVPDDEVPYTLKGHKAGRVISNNGRIRWFNLDNMSNQSIAAIHRKAGNFPIQCFALDLLLEAVTRWNTILKNAGLIDIKVKDDYSPLGYHFENKVKTMAYVHDEMEILVDKDINPRWILKALYNSMVINIPGYPTFYIGAGIVKNWYEAKDGDHEIPSQMFKELASKDYPIYAPYETCTQEMLDQEIKDFLYNRCVEEFNKAGVDIKTVTTLTTKDISNMKSYFVKNKICDLFKPGRPVDKNEKRYNDKLIACLENMFNHKIEVVVVSEEESYSEDDSNFIIEYEEDLGADDLEIEEEEELYEA